MTKDKFDSFGFKKAHTKVLKKGSDLIVYYRPSEKEVVIEDSCGRYMPIYYKDVKPLIKVLEEIWRKAQWEK